MSVPTSTAIAFLAAVLVTTGGDGGSRVPAIERGHLRPGPEVATAAPVLVTPAPPAWVVDPKDPGPDLPPAGRSLFDVLVTDPGAAASFGEPAHRVPFPFTALVERIEGHLPAGRPTSPVKRVLIPLNRSLQRNAARPEFFAYPRVVLAVDTEPRVTPGRAGLLLKDRLFIGYQERAASLEVISWNEDAGRFEFQVVKDYRPGGIPRVLYASRAVCTVCHQNHAPIFARPVWDETQANPAIQALLHAERRGFHGVPVAQGVDIPNAIDNATDRANSLSAYQRVWREACALGGPGRESQACRAGLFALALAYRLSGSRQVNRSGAPYQELLPVLSAQWHERWPHGLAVPDPDIPNRDPLAAMEIALDGTAASRDPARVAERVRQSDVHARFEPSNPRAPLEVWPTSGDLAGTLDRVVAGLASFIAADDVARLDDHLAAEAVRTPVRAERIETRCGYNATARDGDLQRLTFRCGGAGGDPVRADRFAMEGAVYLEAGRIRMGSVERISIAPGDDLRDLTVVAGQARAAGRWSADLELRHSTSGLRARRVDGRLVARLSLSVPGGWRGEPGTTTPRPVAGSAVLVILDDVALLYAAIDRMRATTEADTPLFSDRPFSRTTLIRALEGPLGMTPRQWCCAQPMRAERARLETEEDLTAPRPAAGPGQPAVRLLERHCATCHRTSGPFPPNFLAGEPAQVQSRIAHCAERIFVRLSMWRLHADARPKAPMPPVAALAALPVSPEDWTTSADLRAMTEHVAGILRAQTGRTPRIEDLAGVNYEELRACLPGRARQARSAGP